MSPDWIVDAGVSTLGWVEASPVFILGDFWWRTRKVSVLIFVRSDRRLIGGVYSFKSSVHVGFIVFTPVY